MLNENQVIDHLAKWLRRNGWYVEDVKKVTQSGIDLKAKTSNGCRLLIEAKGETPIKPASKNIGKKQSRNQHRQNLEAGLFKLLKLIDENWDDRLVRCGITLPDNDWYRELVETEIGRPFKDVRLVCFFVREDGTVSTFPDWWIERNSRFPFFGSHDLPEPRNFLECGQADELSHRWSRALRPNASIFKIILMEILEEAAAKNWCNELFCTTCGGGAEIRDSLVRKIGYPIGFQTLPRENGDPFFRGASLPIEFHQEFKVNVIRGLRLLDPEFVFSEARRNSLLDNEHDIGVILDEIGFGPYAYVKAREAIRPAVEGSWLEYVYEYWKGVLDGTPPPDELTGPQRDWQTRLSELWANRVE